MAINPIFNRVEYIKIARIDQNGNDNTFSLESLTKLTIPYTNGSSSIYPIESRTRYNDYFLYQVGSANFDPNPADATTLEYKFTSSVSTSTISHQFGFLDASAFAFYTIPLTTPTNDPFGFYNSDNGSYVFDTYSQKDLTLEITSSLLNNSTFLTTARVSVFVVNPVSVTPNDILSQNGMLATELYGLFGTYPFNKTVTIPSESIAPGNEIRLILSNGGGGAGTRSIKFDPGAEFKISSTAATGPTLETIPEPYLTSQFYGTGCDILLNNINKSPENPFLQDLDYSTNPNVPVNFQLIISGTAARGTVPESYYTALAQTNIRYNGVKNQSSDFNIYNPQAGTSSFGDNINIGTYGQTPSVDILDVNVYEFEWGGGTTPEILDYGAVKLGKILQVSSPDQVKTINTSDGIYTDIIASQTGFSSIAITRNYRVIVSDNSYPPSSVATSSVPQAPGFLDKIFWLTSQSRGDYYQILNKNNPVNHEITMNMYPNSTAGSNPTLPATTRILTTEWGVPTISSYALTSSNPTHYGRLDNVGTTSFIKVSRSLHISKVTTDSNGFYQSGKNPIKPNWATIGDQINRDLNNGERWFVTLYNEFEFPNNQGDYNSVLTTGSLSPYNEGNTGVDLNGNYNDPLAYKGVFEIAGTYDEGGLASGDTFNFVMYNSFPTSADNKLIGGGASGNSLGMLLWKARATGKNEFVIVQDEISGGVQEGAFTSRFTPSYITENFEAITKTYGTNQTG